MTPIFTTVAQRRVCFAGHCFRGKDQVIPDVLYWRLSRPNREPRPLNYIDVMGKDTESEIEDLQNMMMDKRIWHEVMILSLVFVYCVCMEKNVD